MATKRSPKRAGRPAAFFDLDKTIIATSSTLAFSRPFFRGGLMTRRAVLRGAYAQFVFVSSGADADQMERMRSFLTSMVRGWPVDSVREIVAEALHNVIVPAVYDEAVRLMSDHHMAGRDVIIVSASGQEIVEPIGDLLGVDTVLATSMVVEHGRYTGEIENYLYGDNKAEAMRKLAEELGYDLSISYAYSDSITDLAMLEAVGHPYVVNPDKDLRKAAEERGWEILTFEKPIALRSNVPLNPSKQTWAAVATGAAATAAAAGYFAVKHRARQKLG